MIARTIFLIAIVLSASGCQWLRDMRAPVVEAPVLFQYQPSQQQLIQTINNNTINVRQLSAKVRVAMDGAPRISGQLLIEKPRRLSLTAGALNMSSLGIEVGSNDEQFWFWNKVAVGGQTPAIYYANHDEYANSSARQFLPLKPQWVIDALGIVELDPNALYDGPILRSDGNYELRVTEQTGTQSTTRVLVVDPKYGWIRQLAFYDSSGKRIAFVNATNHSYIQNYQVSLPRRLLIHVFDPNEREMEIAVNLSNIEINRLYGNPDQLWTMPTPGDIPSIDLTKVDLNGITSQVSPGSNRNQATSRFQDRGYRHRPLGDRSAFLQPWRR